MIRLAFHDICAFSSFTQRKIVVSYRCFGATYQYHLQGSSSLKCKAVKDCFTLEDGADKSSRNVGKKLPFYVA